MIEPFSTRNWAIRFSPLGDRLRTVGGSYDEFCSDRPGVTVALVAEYFGRSLTEESKLTFARLRGQGVAVIEDRTHNLLDDILPTAKYEIGSLRKLLPVGDGCFVRGLQDELQLAPAELDPSQASWRAMDFKTSSENRDDLDSALRHHNTAEEEFAVARRPAAISARSLMALQNLDFAAMRVARRTNFETLLALIQKENVVNSDCLGGTPAFLVLRTKSPKDLQALLAERGIYCPIHWPRPLKVPEHITWFEDLISLPIDHRYGQQDMEFIASTLASLEISAWLK